jgi:hypothetical protein
LTAPVALCFGYTPCTYVGEVAAWTRRNNIILWDFTFSQRRVWRWMSSGMLCSAVWQDIDQRFRGHYCLIALTKDTVSTSKTSVNIYQNTRRNTPEDSHLDTRRRENLKSHPYWKYSTCWIFNET